jgi:hypothetical protein
MSRFLCLFVLASGIAWSAVRGQEVDVTTVKFTNVRAPTGSNGTWFETDITLNVKPMPGTPGQMVSRVRVALLLGFELPALAGGERRQEHYRAEAECVALEPGRANVRFYLPPELVKRDQLHADPKYWTVELAVGGRALSPTRPASSSSLASAEQRKAFQVRTAQAASQNDGLLQPQFLTPFVNEYPRATPSFVRRDGIEAGPRNAR